jgi:hypothetical protein
MTQEWLSPGSTSSRIVALAIVTVLTLAMVFSFVLPSIRHVSSYKEQFVQGNETLARYHAVQRNLTATSTTTSSLTNAEYLSDFLPGNQDGLIIAELQNQLRSIAVEHSIEVNSSNALPPRKIGSHTYLGLRVSLRGEMKSIHAMLLLIEAARPFLFIERAVLQMDGRRLEPKDAGFLGAPSLLADFDIYGSRLPPELLSIKTEAAQ